jgi:amino acid adenylation domain-containing protein
LATDARQRLASLSEQERHLLAGRLAARRRRPDGSAAIPRRAQGGDTFPLSFAQQRFWFLTQLGTLSSAFNVTELNRIPGPLDIPALRRAVAELVRRHESLRTTFHVEDGRPVQRINDTLPTLDLIDVSAAADPAAEAMRQAGAIYLEPWDLERGPLFRAGVWRLGTNDHLLFVCVHHIVSDGWSKGVLVRDLAALYGAFAAGQASPLPVLPIQCADYAIWQQQWVESDAARAQLAYWTDRMHEPPTLQLPVRGRRGAPERGFHRWAVIPPDVTAALRGFSQREGVTPFMTLLAVFALQLSRYSGQRDVVIGSPFANRTRAEVEGLVGCFMNPLPLRVDVNPDAGFRALVGVARDACLGAVAHQELPFDVLVRTLHPRRDAGQAPLFQAMLLLHNMWQTLDLSKQGAPGGFKIDDQILRGMDGRSGPGDLIYPVAVEVIELEHVLFACFEHAAPLAMFDRSPAHFRALLAAAIAEPDRPVASLRIMDAAERAEVLALSSGGAVSDAASVVPMIEARAALTPQAPAVIAGAVTLTYAELNARANQLARHLAERGVRAETLVGVLLDRSPELIVALLAVLKAGGAYVPLDTASPPMRIADTARRANLGAVISTRRVIDAHPDVAGNAAVVLLDRAAAAIEARDGSDPGAAPRATQTAYVIFTSGSTGRPKCVAVPHAALAAYAASSVDRFALTPADRVLQFASIAFDTAGEEIYPALIAGAALVLRDEAMAASPLAFLDACERQRLTVVDLPTAYWDELTARMAADGLRAPAGLRLMIIGGEKAIAERAVQWAAAAPRVRLLNTYGPTETTIVATEFDVRDPADLADVPIGRPVPGAEVFVLDRDQQPVPQGVAGELYIGGAGLARGYVGEPAMTAERFVPHPFSAVPGARLYRSGDLVCLSSDGTLDFLGRVDAQVKLRGFRVEPGEIESVLASNPLVGQAVVMLREDRPGDRRLVAYVVPAPGAAPAAAELRRYLKDRLPEYMVPAAIVALEALPVTSNGKVDRRALPAPDGERQTDEAFVAPRTGAEERVAAAWREVLALNQVSAPHNLFDLGGHSMSAMKVASRLSLAFDAEIPVRLMFETRTLSELAARAEALSVLAGDTHAVLDPAAMEDEVVL